MIELCVAPIVEGHGEVEAVPILLRRIWREAQGRDTLFVCRPIRQPRMQLVRGKKLDRALDLAVVNLRESPCRGSGGLVLLLLDADSDPACRLGPRLHALMEESHAHLDTACVLAVVEYETWFVAAADSLGEYLRLAPSDAIPEKPEARRLRKGWIAERLIHRPYSETIHQPRMTSAMDLRLARRRAPSFDKLCRELEKRVPRRSK